MKIDLTCPVELWQYAMPSENDAECTFVMNNLSDKVVTSVQVALSCYDAQDELLFRQSERIQGLKAGVGERFTMVILPSQWQGVEGVDLVIEKVWFEDATIWRKGNAPLAHYVSNAIPAGRALDDLRFVAGKDAVGYPQKQEEVWVCVCGRANAPDSERCCRCERRRDAVFASFTRENVAYVVAAHESKLAQTARQAREENSLLQENQEKQRAAKRRKRKQLLRVLVSLAVIAALTAAAGLWGVPTLRYLTAQDLLKDGHYDEARATFSQIEDWQDASTQMLECDYQKALSQLNAGDRESLIQAETGFAALAEYRDSAEMSRKASYELGKIHLENGDYEAAAEKFQTLGEYEECPELLKETTYRQAKALFDAGSYIAARVLFTGLGEYGDAQAQADACTYRLGESYLNGGEYEKAIAELTPLGEYENAPGLIAQAYYAMAENAMQEQNYGNAGHWYLLAGDYADAKEKGNDSTYRYAQEVKANGDYAMAQRLFERIPGYLDSEGQAQTCIYARAEVLRQNGDYAAAAALYGQITNYSDAQTRLDECNYELAMDALEAGDEQKAEAILGGIVDYEDAVKQLRTLRYELAKNDQEKGDYAAAIGRFEMLDGYRDSKTRLKKCRYALAAEKMEAGDYAAAIDLYTALDNYRDSKTLLEDAKLEQADQYIEMGDINAAQIVLTKLGTDKAQQKLDELAMLEAEALEKEGKLEEAIVIYDRIGDPARERASACRYQLAAQKMESGDYVGAAEAFDALDSYRDAKAQSAQCWDHYYGDAPKLAREAAQVGDDLTVIRTLEPLVRNDELEKLYQESALRHAEALYDGDPYGALPFYQRAGEDMAKRKLSRRPYLVLGQWQSATGKTAAFRADGTCDILDETFYFRVQNFSLLTGPNPEEMTITHKLSAIDENGMSLRDIRDGQDTVYKFSRVGKFDLPETKLPLPQPQAEPQPTPAPQDDEMLVTEETDEP